MAGVPEVLKGGFTWTVAAKSLTIAAKGVTKVRFPKVGALGDWVILDMTGKTWTFAFDTQFNAAGCGITETVSWGSAMPWFDFLFNLDNDKDHVVAGMSRNPKMTAAPAAANIHYNDSVSATEAQTNVMLAIASGTDYATAPCVAIGSHTMTYDTTDDDWTPGAIASTDGFGKFQEGVQFTMPVGQNGAAAGKYLYNAGAGTDPTFANNTYRYTISREGLVVVSINLNGNTATDGSATASTEFVVLPYAAVYSDVTGSNFVQTTGAGAIDRQNVWATTASSALAALGLVYATNALVSNFQDGNRLIAGTCPYYAF